MESAPGSARDRMATAAAEILVEVGPAGVTHRRVAAAAGVPLGSANHHFPSARVLLAAAVTRAEERRLAAARAFAGALPRRQRSTRSTARALVETWYAPGIDRDVVRARLRPRIDALHDPGLRAAADTVRPALLETLEDVLDRSGHDRVRDLELVAVVLDSALLYASGTGESDDPEFAVEMLARVLDLSEDGARRATPTR